MLRYPAWLAELPKEEQEKARIRWLIRLYALYATEEGGLKKFAAHMGLSTNYLKTQTQHTFWRQLPPKTAIKIEETLGRDIAPRERLRPDLFTLPETVSK